MNRTKTSHGESKTVFRHTALTRQEVVCHNVHKEEIYSRCRCSRLEKVDLQEYEC